MHPLNAEDMLQKTTYLIHLDGDNSEEFNMTVNVHVSTTSYEKIEDLTGDGKFV